MMSRSRYTNPVSIYLFKVNNKNTKTKCENCSKVTVKAPERRQWQRFGVFIVNFEQISLFYLVFPLLTLNKKMMDGKDHKSNDDKGV